MKQIIVPTDFSKGAWNALLFATKLGEAFDVGEIMVLNAYQAPHAGAATLVSIDRIMQQDSEDGLSKLTNKIKESGLSSRFNFISKSVHSGLVEAINSQITGYNGNLVVMGTQGETGAVEKLFGSNASDVAMSAKCPVIVIPPQADYQGFHNIALASDYDKLDASNLKVLNTINSMDPATKLRIVHVQWGDAAPASKAFMGIRQEDLPHELVEISSGDKVSDALDEYASSNKLDLLIIIKKDIGFFESLFHHSVTKRLTMLGHVPLLVLKRADS